MLSNEHALPSNTTKSASSILKLTILNIFSSSLLSFLYLFTINNNTTITVSFFIGSVNQYYDQSFNIDKER